MPDRVPSVARVTPEGSAPVSVKVIGVSPVAVTAKVPAVFSAKVVDAAEVKDRPARRHRQGEVLRRCSSWRRSP